MRRPDAIKVGETKTGGQHFSLLDAFKGSWFSRPAEPKRDMVDAASAGQPAEAPKKDSKDAVPPAAESPQVGVGSGGEAIEVRRLLPGDAGELREFLSNLSLENYLRHFPDTHIYAPPEGGGHLMYRDRASPDDLVRTFAQMKERPEAHILLQGGKIVAFAPYVGGMILRKSCSVDIIIADGYANREALLRLAWHTLAGAQEDGYRLMTAARDSAVPKLLIKLLPTDGEEPIGDAPLDEMMPWSS